MNMEMTDKDKRYSLLLDKQIGESKKENRSLEFKSNHLEYERIGRYISALSNGACLDGEDYSLNIVSVPDIEDGEWDENKLEDEIEF